MILNVFNIGSGRRALRKNSQSIVVFVTHLAATVTLTHLIVNIYNIWIVGVSQVAETNESLKV